MKITKAQLKEIIKEELEQQLQEREAINHPITYAHAQYTEQLGDLYHEKLGTPMNKKLPENVSKALNALAEMHYAAIEAVGAQGEPR